MVVGKQTIWLSAPKLSYLKLTLVIQREGFYISYVIKMKMARGNSCGILDICKLFRDILNAHVY